MLYYCTNGDLAIMSYRYADTKKVGNATFYNNNIESKTVIKKLNYKSAIT